MRLLFDGAMGTMLYEAGMKSGECSEVFGFKNKEKLLHIHKQYLEAGADIITANTLCANELTLEPQGYSVEEIIESSIKVAKEATKEYEKIKNRYVALDVGPLGKLLEPSGDMTKERAYEIYKRQMIQGEKSGADLILIETMIDLKEAEVAVKAAKENTNLPVFCTMTFAEHGRSYMGDTPEQMVSVLEASGVDGLGVNCSLGPKQILPIIKKIHNLSKKIIIVQPNAGLPEIINGKTVYNIDKIEFTNEIKEFINIGIPVIGGCCGTNPEFIKEISNLLI